MAQTNYTPLTPAGYQAISATSSSAVGLTVPSATTPGTQANFAFIVAETGNFRYRDDGTNPTSAVGTLVLAGQALEYDGKLEKLKIIGAGGTAAINVNYYRAD